MVIRLVYLNKFYKIQYIYVYTTEQYISYEVYIVPCAHWIGNKSILNAHDYVQYYEVQTTIYTAVQKRQFAQLLLLVQSKDKF